MRYLLWVVCPRTGSTENLDLIRLQLYLCDIISKLICLPSHWAIWLNLIRQQQYLCDIWLCIFIVTCIPSYWVPTYLCWDALRSSPAYGFIMYGSNKTGTIFIKYITHIQYHSVIIRIIRWTKLFQMYDEFKISTANIVSPSTSCQQPI